MSILSTISLLSAALALMVGVVIFQKKPRSPAQIVYMLLSVVIAFVAFAEFGFRQAETVASAEFWLVASQLSPLIVSLFTLFVGIYTGSVLFRSLWTSALVTVVPALVFSGIDLCTGTLSGVPVRTAWGWGQSVPRSPLFNVYTIWSTLMMALSAVLAFRYYLTRRSIGGRRQARYVALAVSMVVFIAVVIDTGMNYLDMQLPEYATLGDVLANILIAYAIWRHQLFAFNPGVAADTIIETMSEALFLISPEGKIANVNSSARVLFGIHGKTYTEKTAGEYVKTDSPLLQLLDEGVYGIKGELSDVSATAVSLKKGRVAMLSVAGRTVRNRYGEILGSVVTVRDVTDRVAAEDALRESNEMLEERVRLRTDELHRSNTIITAERERLAVTLGSIGDGVITTDTQGNVTYVNKMGEQVTGWTCAAALGRPVREVLRIYTAEVPDEFLDPVGEAIKSRRKQELVMPVHLQTRTGEVCSVDGSAAPIISNTGGLLGAVTVFRDVTYKEKLEEELLRAKRLESVALLAGGIAHDFNNILTGINNNLFMGKMAAGVSGETASCITSAEREIVRAKRLAVQLLTFAQGGEPVVEICSPRRIIEESIGFFLSGSHCSYQLTFDSDLMNLSVDRGMMEQVLSNCIINAEQAMPEGGKIEVTVENVLVGNEAPGHASNTTSQLIPAGAYIKMVIADHGGGIPENIRDKVFDPFFSTKGKGRGLGLSIAQSIVKKHGGHIRVHAAVPTGTAVVIYLPAVEQSAPEQADTSSIQHNPFAELRAHKILILDDEEVIRLTTKKILETMGYRVVTAATGEEAIALYREAAATGYVFDLVILDLTIAGAMGGRECLEELKKIDDGVLAIVSSGYSNDAVMSQFEQYGFSGVLKKPYDISKLDATIQAVIEERIQFLENDG